MIPEGKSTHLRAYHRSLLLFLSPLALITITWIFYSPSLRYCYLFDDLPQISRNFYLRFFAPSKLFFADTRWLSKLLNQITYQFSKLDPFGYRLGNLILHCLIGLLIFILVYTVFKRATRQPFLARNALLIATLTSGLHLLHPAQTQTVTYITQMRLEGLASLFIFSILLLFSRAVYATTPVYRALWYAGCILMAILGTGSKEIFIILPVLLLSFDWFFLAQGAWHTLRKRLPLHLLIMGALVASFLQYSQPIPFSQAVTLNLEMENNRGNELTTASEQKIRPIPFLMTQFQVLCHYLKIYFWPHNMSFDYDTKLVTSFWQWRVIIPLLFLCTLLLLALYAYKVYPLNVYTFCTFWFFVSVAPRASIIPTPELVCDYKMYIPSFGILLLQATALAFILTIKRLPTLIPYACSHLLMLPLGYVCMQKNTVWESRTRFWEHVISIAPNKARAYNNLAVGYAEQGKSEQAIAAYKKALACQPSYAEPHMNLAVHYQAENKRDKAHYHYLKALELGKAAHPEFYFNLGMFNMKGKDYQKALRCFSIATRLRPYYSKAYYNMGHIHYQRKEYKKALTCYDKALKGNLTTSAVYYAAGTAAYMVGDRQKAITYLQHVQRHQDGYKNTDFMLGCCAYQEKDPTRAAIHFGKACARNPENLTYHYNYALALLACKQYAQAEQLFAACDPVTFPHAPLHAIKCRAYAGSYDRAREDLKKYHEEATHPTLQKQAAALAEELQALPRAT